MWTLNYYKGNYFSATKAPIYKNLVCQEARIIWHEFAAETQAFLQSSLFAQILKLETTNVTRLSQSVTIKTVPLWLRLRLFAYILFFGKLCLYNKLGLIGPV